VHVEPHVLERDGRHRRQPPIAPDPRRRAIEARLERRREPALWPAAIIAPPSPIAQVSGAPTAAERRPLPQALADGRAAVRNLGQMEDVLPVSGLPHQGDPARVGAGIYLEPHRLHGPAHPLLQTDGEWVAAVHHRLAAPQEQERPLLAARHQRLLAPIQDKDSHAVCLLTELVTRAWGPSPLAHVVEQRYEQACFVATPRRVYGLSFERAGLRKHP